MGFKATATKMLGYSQETLNDAVNHRRTDKLGKDIVNHGFNSAQMILPAPLVAILVGHFGGDWRVGLAAISPMLLAGGVEALTAFIRSKQLDQAQTEHKEKLRKQAPERNRRLDALHERNKALLGLKT